MPATLFEPRATVLPDDPHAAYALVVDDHPLAARGTAQFLAAQCGSRKPMWWPTPQPAGRATQATAARPHGRRFEA